MEKIDYGDINKFLVSIGVVLIGLAILTPYLYLKEDFGLYIENSKFESLQVPIQKMILAKQDKVIGIQKLYPSIPILLLTLGLVSSIIGLKRWSYRQKKIDERFDVELEKLKLELRDLSQEEQEQKAQKEVSEIVADELVQEQITGQLQGKSEGRSQVSGELRTLETKLDSIRSNSYLNYMAIERKVINLFENYKSSNFEILPQQKISNRFEVDLLLKAKSKKFADRIIEIKYFKNQLLKSILQQTLNQLNTFISYYKEATNRPVIPVLIVVYCRDNISDEQILSYKNSLSDYFQGIPNLTRLKVEFVEESAIKSFDIRKILMK